MIKWLRKIIRIVLCAKWIWSMKGICLYCLWHALNGSSDNKMIFHHKNNNKSIYGRKYAKNQSNKFIYSISRIFFLCFVFASRLRSFFLFWIHTVILGARSFESSIIFNLVSMFSFDLFFFLANKCYTLFSSFLPSQLSI